MSNAQYYRDLRALKKARKEQLIEELENTKMPEHHLWLLNLIRKIEKL